MEEIRDNSRGLRDPRVRGPQAAWMTGKSWELHARTYGVSAHGVAGVYAAPKRRVLGQRSLLTSVLRACSSSGRGVVFFPSPACAGASVSPKFRLRAEQFILELSDVLHLLIPD